MKRTTREIFKAKKSLGQNFLRSEAALRKIVEAANLKSSDCVLEVGPGEGALTKQLLEKAGKVAAVEKDDRLITVLREKFSAEILSGRLKLVHGDILHLELSELVPRPSAYLIVANIPYYITGRFIRKFLSKWPRPSRAVLLVQKEVAERIIARNGKESLLSISVKAYGRPQKIAVVKAGAFSPPPKVDSAILLIENISKRNFGNISEEKFFEIVKAGFAHKRKLLAGNLKEIFGEKVGEMLEKCEAQEKTRAENLALPRWLCLAKLLKS